MMDMDRIGKVKPGRPIDLFTIGRVYVDIQYFVDELPQPNKAGEILEIYQGCGGCPGNVAVAASRLGLTTAVCAMVGSDVYGTRYIEQLKRENVDVSPMRQDPEKPTGMSVILMDAQGIPAIVRRLGANTELFFDDVDADRLLQAKWLHMAAASNPSVLEEASTLAKENGIVTSFDPGRSMSRKGYQALKTIWDNTDVVIVNREEAGNLVDITYDRLNFAEITEKLVATIGEDRVYILKGGPEAVYARSHDDAFFEDPFDVEVVDTLGAGDAFDAGVITGLLGGQPLRASVVYGNAVAALKIGRKGTQSLPTRSDVESFLTRWT
jgi:ribokinase